MKIASVDLENSVFSQNGEDGIIDYLVGCVDSAAYVKNSERRFVEIGCGNGRENCTTALAVEGWHGVVLDRKPARIDTYKYIAKERGFHHRVKAYAVAATPNAAADLIELFETACPCFFSLDIDGPDWHVMKALLEAGFRPSVCCLEYNAAFENRPIVVRLEEAPKRTDNLYYGAGIKAWRYLMAGYGYEFVTVESAGVNAFFVRREDMEMQEIDKIEGIDWVDCAVFAEKYGPAQQRYNAVIGKHNFVHVAKP
jgi:hypothetical protein